MSTLIQENGRVCNSSNNIEYFPSVPKKVPYLGPESMEPLSFRYYNPDEIILGKPMKVNRSYGYARHRKWELNNSFHSQTPWMICSSLQPTNNVTGMASFLCVLLVGSVYPKFENFKHSNILLIIT